MRRWLLDEDEGKVFAMPGAIHWGYEDRNLTGSELIPQDESTRGLVAGGPPLQRPDLATSTRGFFRGGAVEILEA